MKPGVSASTKNRSAAHALFIGVIATRARGNDEIAGLHTAGDEHFCPFSTHSLPSFRAVVLILATSEPPPGSVIPESTAFFTRQ